MASFNAWINKPEEWTSARVVALLLQGTILEHYVGSYACNQGALAKLLAQFTAADASKLEALAKQRVATSLPRAGDNGDWEDIRDEAVDKASDRMQTREIQASTVLGIAMPPGLLTNRAKPTFLGCSLDIRRLVYDLIFPVGHKVTLTYSSDATSAKHYAIDRAGLSLMVTCRQINVETSSLVYGENTFVFTPREANGNAAKSRHPYANSDIWLSYMRPDTKRMARSLKLHLNCPRDEDIEAIANGLGDFQRIRVEVARLGNMSVPTRLRKRPILGRLCRSIAEKRCEGQQTVWDDSGDIEIAAMFQLYLPAGYTTHGPTEYERLDSPALWL